jgi:hypothetical protein
MAQRKAGQTVIEAWRAEGVEYTCGVVGTTVKHGSSHGKKQASRPAYGRRIASGRLFPDPDSVGFDHRVGHLT